MNKLVNRFRTWLFADFDLRLTALEGKSADQQKGLIEACGAIDQNARISEENFRGISVTFSGVGKRLDSMEGQGDRFAKAFVELTAKAVEAQKPMRARKPKALK